MARKHSNKVSGCSMSEAISTTTNLDPLMARARELLEAERYDAVVELVSNALSDQPTNPDYIGLLTQGLMPGPGYKHWLHRLHRALRPRSYVEIGVSKGVSLSAAMPETHCVGIDPAFRIEAEIEARARLYPCTSDEFFTRYNLPEELGTPNLDLAFIDGLHLFEQVLRDFINIERYAGDSTVMLIHDCYPVSEITASRERQTDFWSGDVWRIVPCLIRERPDLQVSVVPCKPCGLAVVTGLDPANRTMEQDFEAISARYLKLGFSEFVDEGRTAFPRVDNNWREISALLPRSVTTV